MGKDHDPDQHAADQQHEDDRDQEADTASAVHTATLAVRARRLLVLGTVVPVVVLTLLPVWVAYSGGRTPGPAPGSVFLTMGRLTANTAPLFMVCVGLIIHALRERLPGYAFLVGLGGNLMVSLIVRGLHRIRLPGIEQYGTEPLADWYVQLLQVNAIAFAATALLWLAANHTHLTLNGLMTWTSEVA